MQTLSMQALITKAMDVENEDAPRTYDEAMGKPDSQLWRKAIHDELQSMEQQQVWKLVPRVDRTVGCKWVFVVKRNEFHEITRYKARLVAQGFSQRPVVDFEELYAPVVRYYSLRLLMALAVKNG